MSGREQKDKPASAIYTCQIGKDSYSSHFTQLGGIFVFFIITVNSAMELRASVVVCECRCSYKTQETMDRGWQHNSKCLSSQTHNTPLPPLLPLLAIKSTDGPSSCCQLLHRTLPTSTKTKRPPSLRPMRCRRTIKHALPSLWWMCTSLSSHSAQKSN